MVPIWDQYVHVQEILPHYFSDMRKCTFLQIVRALLRSPRGAEPDFDNISLGYCEDS